MTDVEVVDVEPCAIAAVRGHVTLDTLPTEIGKLLDLVWAYLRGTDLVTNHNVALYRGDVSSEAGAEIEVGVQVDRAFDGESPDGVRCTELPAARVARATHTGPYDRISETHTKVVDFCRKQDLELTGTSWEIYGDWNDDPTQLETEVAHAVMVRTLTASQLAPAHVTTRRPDGRRT